MNTSTINHRPATLLAVATTGFVGALLTLSLSSAQASPQRDEPSSAAVHTVHTARTAHTVRVVDTDGHDLERPCFIKPAAWNTSLDGPLPRCHTYLP